MVQGWNNLWRSPIWPDEFTYEILIYHYILNLEYRPPYSKYKGLYYTPQNHSTMTIQKFCLLVSDEGIVQILASYNIVETCTTSYKITKA